MITYTREKLAAALGDVCSMLPAQYEHTGDPDLPVDPAWNVYDALEAKDCAALFMVRDNDRAIGYAAVMYHPNLNSQHVWVGSIPTWYVEECPDRALIARALLRAAQAWCIAKGARQVIIQTRYQQSAGRLLELMGFVPDAISYKMALSPQQPSSQMQQ